MKNREARKCCVLNRTEAEAVVGVCAGFWLC